jgi:Zn-dependent protease with chaperone function/uncharacterized tellurite resistance protein B-like protein
MASFFEQQDRARRASRALGWLMALAVLGIALSVCAVLVGLRAWAASRATGRWALEPALLPPGAVAACVLGTAAVVSLAARWRMFSLRGGGSRIAEMLGGRLVSGQPRDGLERRLLNVVEEMAIASGVPVPHVFVLDQETAINAFAAGFSIDDAAVTVTRGGLEKLTREELQGVVAHEMSHVLNGDMRLNMRLMGVVFGIVCVGLLGRTLIRIAWSTDDRPAGRKDDSRDGVGLGVMLFAFGLGVFSIGLVGELFGKLIKAAIGRQRELLADASAVQFTRNPRGIVGALKKIGGYSEGSQIRAPHAEETSHFFFGDMHALGAAGLGSFDPFATHPPLRKRIALIDPSFDGDYPVVGPGVAEQEDGSAAPSIDAPPGLAPRAQGTPIAQAVVAQVGTVRLVPAGPREASGLPPTLRAFVENPFGAGVAVYALLLSDDPAVQERQRAAIAATCGEPMRLATERLFASVRPLARRDRLLLVSIAAPALRSLSRAQRSAFSATVDALITADGAISVFEAVVGQTLRARLADEGSALLRSRVRYRSLGEVRERIELLLSLMATAGDPTGRSSPQAFLAGAARIPELRMALRAPTSADMVALPDALRDLAALTPALAAQVIDACVNVVLADRQVTDDEETLLRAVCDALGAPLPRGVVAG